MAGFEDFKATPEVLAYLGALPRETAVCLSRAFQQLREGRISLLESGRPGLRIALVCDHIVLLSCTHDESTAVVVGIFEDDT